MNKINEILSGHTIPDVRGALYYLGRYIKQANDFEKYEKNIFEDSIESIPSEVVIKLTWNLIDAIENEANKKATEFSDQEVMFWLDFISDLEDKIDPEPTDSEKQKALNQLSRFKVPSDDREKLTRSLF